MFKKWRNKAKAEKEAADKAAAEAKAIAEAAKEQKPETMQAKVEEKIEDVKEAASDMKDAVASSAFWIGLKQWIDRHLLCCISKEGEAPKLGAITDVKAEA
jgi:rubrerythrin